MLLLQSIPPGVVERRMIADVPRQFDIDKGGRIVVMRDIRAFVTVEVVEVIARLGALLGVLHPAVFPVVVGIDTGNAPRKQSHRPGNIRQLRIRTVPIDPCPDFEPFGHVRREIEPVGGSRHGRIVDYTRIVHIRHRHEIFDTLRRAAGRDRMLLIDRRGKDRLHPVHVGIGHIVRIARIGNAVGSLLLFAPQVDHRLAEHIGLADIPGRLVHDFHVVGIVRNDIEIVFRLLIGHHAGILDIKATLLGRFGRNQDHAVGSAVSIDGAGGGVLQDRNRGDILRIHIIDGSLETVHNDQRRGIIERSHAANPHRNPFAARFSGGLRDIQTRAHTLQQSRRRGSGTGLRQLLIIHRRDRTGHIHLLLHAVTDDDQFIEYLGFRHHLGIQDGGGPHLEFLAPIAQEIKDQRLFGRSFDPVFSIRIGRHAPVCAFDNHRSAGQRKPRLIINHTGNDVALSHGRQRYRQEDQYIQYLAEYAFHNGFLH